MPVKITAWQCQFCSRYRKTKASIARHEKICFHNPDRKILEGSLAIFATMPRELLLADSYGVPNSEWQEPNWDLPKELSEKYKWWPREKDGALGLGYIYAGGEWVKIEGYKPPCFAPGLSWRDEEFTLPETNEPEHTLRPEHRQEHGELPATVKKYLREMKTIKSRLQQGDEYSPAPQNMLKEQK